MDNVAINDEASQQVFALLKRHAPQVEVVEVKKIEGIIDDGNALTSGKPRFSGTKSGALLHQAERRTPLVVKRDDLSIKNGAARFNEFRKRGKLRILRCEVILVA